MTVWTAIVTSQVFAITLRILLSIGLGALIGLERQLRARSAGIRTNALVSLGSCLFTTVGVYTLAAGTGDPTRVAAQVASGIGFLGAGVILKQGVSVSGLNTAATLWASAAVGTLCGSGMEAAAAIGATAIMLANMMLRPIGAAIDARRTAQSHEAEGIRYTLEVKCLRKEHRHRKQHRNSHHHARGPRRQMGCRANHRRGLNVTVMNPRHESARRE